MTFTCLKWLQIDIGHAENDLKQSCYMGGETCANVSVCLKKTPAVSFCLLTSFIFLACSRAISGTAVEIVSRLRSRRSKHLTCTAARQNTTVQVLAFEALTTAMKDDHTAQSIISASDSE